MKFMEAIETRRTIYGLGKDVSLTKNQIEELVKNSINHSPSAFNSQSTKAIILFTEEHTKFWQIVKMKLKEIVPAENFAQTEEKIDSFAAGFGSILFFDDSSIVEGLQKQFPSYSDNFPIWAQQANGMAQFVVWTNLTANGLGASLQHYNPLIDEDVAREWSIPANWKLIAQMPFGNITVPAGEKQFASIEERVKIFG